MFEPEQLLRKLSLDQDIQYVLRTPNRIKYNNQEFQGWQNLTQHPLQSPQRKINFNTSRPNFKVKISKIRINHDSIIKNPEKLIQNKQNHEDEKLFNLKMIKIIEEKTLSPNSRKMLTPNKLKSSDEFNRNFYSKNRLYQTPNSTHRVRDSSLHKLSLTEGINKLSFTEKRQKYLNEEDQFINDENGFKIPLSSIVYPVLKSNNKKSLRRIERFHSFVARTVRK